MLGKHSKWLFTLSLAFLVVAIILAAWGFPKIIGNQIQKNVQIENSSMMFDKWVKLPMPLTFKVYLFNVTNVDEINEGEKPRLQEIGPYIYKQYRERTHLKYGPNDTVKYMLKKTFIYDSEASGDLTEDDQLTVINFSYLGAIHQVNDMMPMAVGIVNGALVEFFGNLTDPFYTVSVKDLLFDGIFLNCIGNNSALALVCGQIRANTPATMRPAENGTGFYFSMFSHMNLSESGPYVIKRGTENIKELGSIVSYKGDTSMSQWGDKYCGQINGTDSTIYPPIDEDNVPSRLYNFEPEICRSLYASLVDKRTFFNISTYYYEISESALAAHSANHENKCFCKKNWSGNHDGCLIMGLLNLQPCQGAPALASLPHFYLGSDELLEYFDEGISPDKEKHNTYVYIDPVTGVILKGAKRMQFNIELRRFENIPQLRQVPTGLFPLLWIEEGAEIPDYLKTEILNSHNLLSYVEAARWILLGIAIICVIVCAAAVARSASLFSWPHNSNSVSFILNASPKNGNKGM